MVGKAFHNDEFQESNEWRVLSLVRSWCEYAKQYLALITSTTDSYTLYKLRDVECVHDALTVRVKVQET